MTAAHDSDRANPGSRRLVWIAAVILAFILGYLLARHNCARDRLGGGTGSGGVVARGGSVVAAPSRGKVGGGPGDATSSGGRSNAGGDVDTSNGGNGGGGGGGSDDPGKGGGSGNIPADSGSFKKSPRQTDSLSTNFVGGLASSKSKLGRATLDSAPPDPKRDTRTANDFSLDETGLPRYGGSVTHVVSSISTKADTPGDTGTAAGIMTTDSFETVTAWYHAHMPAGWHEVVLGDLQQTAQQLSPQNIMKMLSQATGTGTSPDTTATVAATPAGERKSVALWTAPDNDHHRNRGIMVESLPGKPTTVLLKRTVQP
ncbi:MAG: hypothetical protein ACREOJ_15350 [Gemmatimonadaceae bacterium]